ncbi:MAG: 2-thiouracil desulfurase family protein [Candidatus Ratteibacteria bacterium]|nr:2-thiouracil desulfurase family protein [Candidatus Ratteibacteria bacterium]
MKNKPIILAVSHCLLNPEVRAKGLSQHTEINKKILKLAEKYNAKVEQLPCPEFLFLGEREPKTYDEYAEIKGFKEHCKKLAETIANKLKKTGNCHTVVIGIARSPSCAISQVYDRNNKLKKGEGILIHFLRKRMKAILAEIDYHRIDNSMREIEDILRIICPLSEQFRRSRET